MCRQSYLSVEDQPDVIEKKKKALDRVQSGTDRANYKGNMILERASLEYKIVLFCLFVSKEC